MCNWQGQQHTIDAHVFRNKLETLSPLANAKFRTLTTTKLTYGISRKCRTLSKGGESGAFRSSLIMQDLWNRHFSLPAIK